MENKINIAEILKNCPKGMELDCTIFNDVTLYRIDTSSENEYPIRIETKNGNFLDLTKYGTYTNVEESKCLIFPKGKTTWEGFQRPFKDGDIVAASSGNWIGITTGGKSREFMPTYCVIKGDGKFEAYLDKKETWQFSRFATEEEKQKLFDAIKDNGYKWNEETNTLEKLINPRFKIGNRIKSKINQYEYTIIDITKDDYIVCYKTDKFGYHVPFCNEDEFDLIPNKFDVINFEPFMKVLVRSDNSDVWECDFFSLYNPNCSNRFHCIGAWYNICIPYIGNEHLRGTTNDCDEYFKNW